MNPTPAPCPIAGECLPALSAAAFAALPGHLATPAALLGHHAAILRIALELQRSAEEVARLYCAELERRCGLASVNDYLAILIERKVREQLRTVAPANRAPG